MTFSFGEAATYGILLRSQKGGKRAALDRALLCSVLQVPRHSLALLFRRQSDFLLTPLFLICRHDVTLVSSSLLIPMETQLCLSINERKHVLIN